LRLIERVWPAISDVLALFANQIIARGQDADLFADCFLYVLLRLFDATDGRSARCLFTR
jgi:hypothetical protein